MKVFFIQKTEQFKLDEYPAETVLVYHEMYEPPILAGVEVLPWQKYKVLYNEMSPELLILVGLNRMVTPANRCDFIHTHLTSLTPHIEKYSVDNKPFMGEPWRVFYHYQYSNTNKFGASYSYPIEGEWQKWFYRDTNECRLSADNIGLFINQTYSELPKLQSKFNLIDVDDNDAKWYEEAKGHIFDKYNTPKLLISNLLKLANQHYGIKFDFDSYLENKAHTLPNLGIYRFIMEENIRRRDIYNRFCNENI